MNNNLLQYPSKDTGVYPPRYENGYYDVEKEWERRYHNRITILKWRTKLADFGKWLVALEQHLIHKPYTLTHAHAKSAASPRHIRK
jgi:hypothetical protein